MQTAIFWIWFWGIIKVYARRMTATGLPAVKTLPKCLATMDARLTGTVDA